MQKTRKLISMLLAVMMVLSMCTVGMMSVSALPENAVINDVEGNDASGINGEIFGLLGDADLNEKINVKDATEIQKSAAKLLTLDETATVLADVDLNEKVNVKDATAIQKWVAKIAVDAPINCLVYIPAEETTGTEPTTGAVEPTTAATVPTSTPDESKPPVVTVPIVTVPTTGADPTDATEPTSKATEPSEATEPTSKATEPSEATEPTSKATEPSEATEPSTVTEPTQATTVTDAPAPQTITVYFTNSNGWENVNIYYWGGTGAASANWPGQAMTFVETNEWNQDIYSYELSADVEGVVFNGHSDTVSGNDKQTVDVKEGLVDNAGFYPSEQVAEEGADQGKWNVGTYTYEDKEETTVTTTTQGTTAKEETTASQPASSATEPASSATQPASSATQPTTVVDDGMITVYFTNNKGWEGTYIYGFYGEVGVEATSEPLGKYPGTAMTYVRDNQYGQAIYSAEIPADIDYIKFSDGTSTNNRTDNIPNAEFGDSIGFYLLDKGEKYWPYETYEYDEGTENSSASQATTPSQATTASSAATDPTESKAPETQPSLTESDYVLHGNFSGEWANVVLYVSAADSNVATATMTVEAGSYEFVMHNLATDEWLKNGGTFEDTCDGWRFGTDKDGNTTFTATGGTYTFSFDLTTLKLSVTKGTVVEPTEATSVATQPTSSEATSVATQPTSTEATSTATQPSTAEGPVVAPEAPAPAAVVIEGAYGGTGTEKDPFLVAPSEKMAMVITGELGDADGLGYNVNYYRSFVEWEVGQTSVSYNGVKAPALDATQAVNVYLIAYNVAEDGTHLQSATYATTIIWVKGSEMPEPTEPSSEATQPSSEATQPSSEATEPTTETTPAPETVTITFNGAKTTWINDASAVFVLVDNDTKAEYPMTKGSNYTWTVEVPETVVNVTFNRNNPSTNTAWNTWKAGDRGEAVQYNTTGSGTGAWAGDTSVKYYVMGSFNNWSTGDAMKANADGSYTQEIELAAGSYEYKIATADWSTEYPSGYGNNATLTVTTAGTYVFTLTASGEISAVAK